MINRFVILCIIIYALSNVMNGMVIQSLGDVSAAFALQCETCEKARPFFWIAAATNVYKMRFLGTLGFILAAMDRLDIAEKILALHYGLIGIDDDNAAPIGRLSTAVAGFTLAM